MNPEDAEEYTQALGQVVAGSWRHVALGVRLGVPEALGITTKEWVAQRLGGYVRLSVDERREAVTELRANGHSNRQSAEILGIGEATVRRDIAPNDAQPSAELADIAPDDAPITPEMKARADRLAPLTREERQEAERLAFTRDWWKRTESALLHLSTGCRAGHYADEYGPIYEPVQPFTVPELIDDVIAGLTDLKGAITHGR